MNKINLPHNDKQKFQIGDICKIVKGSPDLMNNTYPEVEPWNKEREVIILYSYSQVYWGRDYSQYAIMFLDNGGHLAWLDNNQLEYIRKPTDEEKQVVIREDRESDDKSEYYTSIFSTEDHSAIRWDAYFQ